MRLGGAVFPTPLCIAGMRTGTSPSWWNKYLRRMIQIPKPWLVLACWCAGKMIKCRSKRKFGYALWQEIHAQTWPSNTCAGHAQRRINQENVCCWCFGIMRPGILAKRPWSGCTHIIVKSNILEKELGCWFVYCRKRVLGWIRLNPSGFTPNVKLSSRIIDCPQVK